MKRIQLPKGIYLSDENIITHAEIKKLTLGELSGVSSVLENSGAYMAYEKFIKLGVVSYIDMFDEVISDNVRVSGLNNKLPFFSAEHIMIEILKMYEYDDGISGIYECPLCKTKIQCKSPRYEGDIDTRDFLSDLEVVYDEEQKSNIIHEMSEPVIISNKKTGEVLSEVRSITYRYSTLHDCVDAYMKTGQSSKSKLQLKILSNSIIEINGQEVSPEYKRTWADYIIDHITDIKNDVNAVSAEMQRYGINPKKKKTCLECGQEWYPVLDTSSFFECGLNMAQK